MVGTSNNSSVKFVPVVYRTHYVQNVAQKLPYYVIRYNASEFHFVYRPIDTFRPAAKVIRPFTPPTGDGSEVPVVVLQDRICIECGWETYTSQCYACGRNTYPISTPSSEGARVCAAVELPLTPEGWKQWAAEATPETDLAILRQWSADFLKSAQDEQNSDAQRQMWRNAYYDAEAEIRKIERRLAKERGRICEKQASYYVHRDPAWHMTPVQIGEGWSLVRKDAARRRPKLAVLQSATRQTVIVKVLARRWEVRPTCVCSASLRGEPCSCGKPRGLWIARDAFGSRTWSFVGRMPKVRRVNFIESPAKPPFIRYCPIKGGWSPAFGIEIPGMYYFRRIIGARYRPIRRPVVIPASALAGAAFGQPSRVERFTPLREGSAFSWYVLNFQNGLDGVLAPKRHSVERKPKPAAPAQRPWWACAYRVPCERFVLPSGGAGYWVQSACPYPQYEGQTGRLQVIARGRVAKVRPFPIRKLEVQPMKQAA